MTSLMKKAARSQCEAESAQQELFAIQLTRKQAQFIARLLPLRYSLQPQRKKRGCKSHKHLSKQHRRSNLPPKNVPIQGGVENGMSKPSQIMVQKVEKEPASVEQVTNPADFNEETRSMHHFPIVEKKKEDQSEPNWRLFFIKEAKTHALFQRAYGKVLELLEEKLKSNTILNEDFHQTIINVINDEKMRKTKRGVDLAEEFKNLYFKHQTRSNFNLQNAVLIKKMEDKHVVKDKNMHKNQKNPIKKQVKSPPKVSLPSSQKPKKTGSQSSDDLGIDFDINHYPSFDSSTQLTPREQQFLDINSIIKTLKMIPNNYAMQLLSTYGIKSIDALEMRTLSNEDLTYIKQEAQKLFKKYGLRCTDLNNQQIEQSSFEIEQDD